MFIMQYISVANKVTAVTQIPLPTLSMNIIIVVEDCSMNVSSSRQMTLSNPIDSMI